MNLRRKSYFTLIGSLPYLPAPGRAERLPINRQRLKPRFGLLEAQETRELSIAGDLLFWGSASFETDAEVMRRYDESLREITHPGLKSFIDYCMELRTILAALRRREKGMGAPTGGESRGVGPHALSIERNWDKPNFRLGAIYPWLAEAQESLSAGHAEDLQRLQIDLLWKHLSRVAELNPFSFDAVFAYRFKWHILDQWLSRDPQEAAQRFRHLVEEVSHETQQNVA